VKRSLFVVAATVALLFALVPSVMAAEYQWQGNGYPNSSCSSNSSTMLWIWTGDDPTSLTINGQVQPGTWTQQGNGSWHFTTAVTPSNFPPTSASVTYTGSAGTLTLSGCDEGGTPTPTPTPTPTQTPTPT
jgi:hypothetical protein